MKRLLLAVFFVVLPGVSPAATMYITDTVEASVNSGKGLEAGSQFLENVRTGDKVDVLATEGEYARVMLASGAQGWIHTRYLVDQPPPDHGQLTEKIRRLQEELAGLKNENAELEAVRDQQALKIKDAEAAYARLEAGCTDYTKCRAEVDKAQKALRTSNDVIGRLKRENENLAQNAQLMWFIFGAGAVLCGFVIGMWLQSLRRRRKSKFTF
ncbi:MAG: TIGR04211 family SH3 domain-containing protein [Deltaproteobacteria bacterium]|nr:TIGR04211 family SH3 domain-containing protein [Deltaproteobacteria bacterium]